MKVGVASAVRNKPGSVEDIAEYFGPEPRDESQFIVLCRPPTFIYQCRISLGVFAKLNNVAFLKYSINFSS